MKSGSPWHHEDITCRALLGDQGCNSDSNVYGPLENAEGENLFSPGATKRMAWHADYIDAYLYNPFWWVLGDLETTRAPDEMRHRYLAAMSNYWALTSLHFDDLTSSEEIHQAWTRYLNGTLIGLEWAAENKDYEAAYNILGLSLHAVQDFYSHSTWMDDKARRSATYTQTNIGHRSKMILQTGAYESPHGMAHNHGTYDLTCGLQKQPAISTAFDVFCAGVIPTANLEVCEDYRKCDQAASSETNVDVGSEKLGFIILNPPGINLDNTEMAKVGADMRNITRNRGQNFIHGDGTIPSEDVYGIDVREKCSEIIGHGKLCERDSDVLFANAKHLAVNQSQQWMRTINTYMTKHHAGFWENVRRCTVCRQPGGGTLAGRVKQFEDYQQLPFQFITAGFNSPAKKLGDDQGWYLRIEVDTGTEIGDGTNSDIKAIGSTSRGEEYVLDYLALSDPHGQSKLIGLTYDDMEPGDKQVYTVGPFAEVPDQLTLFNDSGDADDVIEGFIHDAGVFFEDAFEGLESFFLNEHDYVGHKGWAANRRELDQLIDRNGGRKTISINGGAEGSYEIDLIVRHTAWRGSGIEATWKEYEIELLRMYCVDESDVDGLTGSDEPFFFLSLNYYGINDADFIHLGPYTNIGVDDGDVRQKSINRKFQTFRLPSEGAIYLAVEARESDDEGRGKRDELYRKFKGATDASDLDDYSRFIDEFGKSIGAPWKIKNMDVYAFQRGLVPKYGKVYSGNNINMWIENNESKRFILNKSNIKTLEAGQHMLNPPMLIFVPAGGFFIPGLAESLGENDSGIKPLPENAEISVREDTGIVPSNGPRVDIRDAIKVSCASSIQGKIAWNYDNSKTWGPQNIEKLCAGNTNSREPALCFEEVMHGIPGQRVKYSGLKRPDTIEWTWQEAVELCQGTKNRTARQICFTKLVGSGTSVSEAINECGTGLK